MGIIDFNGYYRLLTVITDNYRISPIVNGYYRQLTGIFDFNGYYRLLTVITDN